MITGITTNNSNESLVELYQSTRDEKVLEQIIINNNNLLIVLVTPYLDTIPKAELDDLMSEAYMATVKAVNAFDTTKGNQFTTILRACVIQAMNRLYAMLTKKKRYSTGESSYEKMVEENSDGKYAEGREFAVECKDIKAIEFLQFIDSLNLNAKEKVVVNVLMSGGGNKEVSTKLNCTPATATYYFRTIREKFILAGYSL